MTLTIVPAAYPELEAEVYLALDPETERPTEVPPPAEQLGLQVECFLG